MEFTGKIKVVLPEVSGTSSHGEWKSQQYVVETEEQYPKRLLFEVFGAEKFSSLIFMKVRRLLSALTLQLASMRANGLVVIVRGIS